jgi:Flp pilus assembly protein TadD
MSSNPIKQQYDQAMKTLRAGDAQEAELICRRVLPQSRQDLNIICLLGEICLKQRRPQEAETWFKKVLKQKRDFPRALEGLGLALLADGKAKKATGFLSRAAELAPTRAKTRMALGRALAETGHADPGPSHDPGNRCLKYSSQRPG